MIKVMVVDDEFATRNFLCRKVPQLNAECVVVGSGADGREALELLESTGADLVITDIKMPVMDGLELCREIRSRYPGIFTAILSGYGEFDFARQAIQNGVSDFLLKPIINDQLKCLLDAMRDRIRLQSEQRMKQLKGEKLVGRTSEWLVCSYIKSAALGRKAETASCKALLEELDIQPYDGPFSYLQFSMAAGLFSSSYKYLSSSAETGNELKNTVEKAAEALRGYVFSDPYGNAALLVPTPDERHFCRTAESAYQRVAGNLPAGFGEIRAAAVFAGETGKLSAAYEQAVSLAFSDSRKPVACFIPEVHFFPEPDCMLVTDKEYQRLSDIKKGVRTLQAAVSSGDSLTVSAAAGELFLLISKAMPDKSPGEKLYGIGIAASLCFEEGRSGQWLDEMTQLSRDCDRISASGREEIPGELTDRFVRLLRRLKDREISDRPSNSRIVESARDIILNNYRQPVSLSSVAGQIGVSANYLSDVFSRETGETFLKYLTRVRMRIAAHYVESKPAMSMNEIAEKTGYVSSKHFLHIFKKYFGMTPSDYRRRIKGH